MLANSTAAAAATASRTKLRVCTILDFGFNQWANVSQNDESVVGYRNEQNIWDESDFVGYDSQMRRHIFGDMAIPYDILVCENYNKALQTVREGHCDLASGPFTITTDREYCGYNRTGGCIDFFHPYVRCGSVGFMYRNDKLHERRTEGMIPPAVANTLSVLFLLTVASGHIMWLIESTAGNEQFSKSYFTGIGDGFWWAISTASTVGYGTIFN
jgi:hypothetical protein